MMDKIGEAENIADMAAVRWHMIGHLQKNKVKYLGLMTSAPYTEDPETNRLFFRKLNALAHELYDEKLIVTDDPDFSLPVLSMGMTGDYEVAVEEGATMVRVGTAIFGNRNYSV